MADELPGALRDELRAAWHRYVDLTAPLRPALHGYCRRLTGNLWDAEDLVQDTLLRAFATLGSIHHEIANPRGYLLRVASNSWIDAARRRELEAREAALAAPEPSAKPRVDELRDASAALLQRLAPQERAALVLKEAFELSLEEIAATLNTSVGAVKAALHRGRERLRDEAPPRRPRTSRELVDAFVAAYNAADLEALLALMQDGGQVENVGCGLEYGSDNFRTRQSWFHAALQGHAEWPAELQYEAPRMQLALVGGEPVALGFVTRRGREALEQVMRIDEHESRIARLRGYAFCPETMRAIGEELGIRVRTGLYRYPTPAAGEHY
ncbi:MAG: RNA polymerase sigma factor [Deltaproteobacteria bacterium]|nr:RNA polymerase sigma factor [Deltaproteobacteria bacterium]